MGDRAARAHRRQHHRHLCKLGLVGAWIESGFVVELVGAPPGAWGAVYTEGWDRAVKLTGDVAKAAKREINTLWIYPPADRDAAFEMANPDFVIVP
jgi:hypothetical protein